MLQHVSLEVQENRAADCVAFWALLGFTEVEPPATLADSTRWVERGETQIHLLFAEEPTVPATGHAAVVVEDYEATLAALREDGYEPDLRREHWGAPRAFVRDPAGHRVEVMAAPPPA